MKKDRGVAAIIVIIIAVIIILSIIGIFVIRNNNSKKEENFLIESNQLNIENKATEEMKETENNNNVAENIQTEKENADVTEYKYEFMDKTQMLNWNSIKISGKSTGGKDNAEYKLSLNTNSKASEVMKQHPYSEYESTVFFKNSNNIQSILSQMEIDKEKDRIAGLHFVISGADEFFINDIQLNGLKLSAVQEKLGQPYATISHETMRYYIYRYNEGYILINFAIKTRYVNIVKNEDVSNINFFNKALKNIV